MSNNYNENNTKSLSNNQKRSGSRNYEDYKPINPCPPRKRRNPLLALVQYSIIFLLMISLIISCALFVISHLKDEGKGKPAPEINIPKQNDFSNETDDIIPDDTTVPDEQPEDPVPIINLDNYTEIEYFGSNLHKGSLILVGANNKAVHPSNDELTSLGPVKTTSYQVSLNTMKVHKDIVSPMNNMLDAFALETDLKDVIIQTGYRDEVRQKQVYDQYVQQHGEDAAKNAVSKPGESDHHTGLGIVLKVFRAGKTYELREVDGYSWILENCHKYGFVERYPADKLDHTGIDYSSTVYLRYVGIPQAEIMKNNGICLEEFIIMIKGYTFGEAHYEYTAEDGTQYEIYYVSCQDLEAETVKIPVPKNTESYEISGNNIDGFIVTAKIQK